MPSEESRGGEGRSLTDRLLGRDRGSSDADADDTRAVGMDSDTDDSRAVGTDTDADAETRTDDPRRGERTVADRIMGRD